MWTQHWYVCVCVCVCEPLYMYMCSHVTCIYVHQYTNQYGKMVSGIVKLCALMHMYSPIGFVPYSMQADPKTILSHGQMMQDYPRFSENLKRELTEEEKAKFIVSIIFVM